MERAQGTLWNTWRRPSRWVAALGIALLTLGLGAPAHATNLVTNGSFETPTSGLFFFGSIPGWTLVSGGGGFIETNPASTYGVTGQDGVRVLELDSNSNTRIRQNLSTTPGYTYRLSFLTAKRGGTLDASNQIRAYWDGTLMATVNPTSTVMANNSLLVTATSNLTALEFEGGGTSDSLGSMLDNVRVDYIPVAIDIKPGSFPNSINLGSNGTVPVAILSTPDFNASTATIDLSSISFANTSVRLKGNGSYQASNEDVNGDGILDLVIHFETQALDLTDGDVTATLTGFLIDGTPFIGSDSIRVVPAN
jgi:hypothetical protein